jgi:intracellular septation protein
MTEAQRNWVRIGVDFVPVLAFAGVWIITHNYQPATWTLMIASVLALGIGYAVERKLAPLPLLAGGFALVFGTLALVLHDKNLIKMKLTVYDGGLAAACFVSLLTKANPLKWMMGDKISLPDGAWRTLMIRYALFFAVSAAANEAVWRTQSDATWAIFRVGLLIAAVVFSVAQTPFFMKHMPQAQGPAPTEPPDPGF